MPKNILLISSLLLFSISNNLYPVKETKLQKEIRWITEKDNSCCCRQEENQMLASGTGTVICCVGAMTVPQASLLQPLAFLWGVVGFLNFAGNLDEIAKRDDFLKHVSSVKKMQ
ncbi:MAG TPA: hypothetical protein VLG50_02690 [Candidatus Saccharimonadales bacterium]|nr:hypothetical protein [Candidatus Saccharimonadales bacterium]